MWVFVHMSCVYTVVRYVGKCNFKDLHLYIDSLCFPEYVLCTLFDPGVFGVREFQHLPLWATQFRSPEEKIDMNWLL